MDYFPLPRLNARPYRNVLHDFDSYNYTIVLRVFKLTDLEKFKEDGSRPTNWDNFDDTTITLAATGGSYSFPNCWGDPAQQSDTFIQNLTVTIPLGARGIFGGTTGSSITFTIKEPNGINFLPTLLSAWNTLNEFRQDQVLSATDQVPVLLSIYFNAPPNSQSASAVGDVYTQLSSTVRHIPIVMTKVNFDISSSGTNYNVDATTFSTSAQLASTQRVIYEKITEIEGVKVGDFLSDLMIKMNKAQAELTKDDSNEKSKEILTFAIQPVGTRAQNFFNSTLSATLKDGASLADSQMKSPDDLNDLFGAPEQNSNTTTQPPLPSDGPVVVPPATPPPAYTSELGKKRQQILLAAMDKFGIVNPNERANFWANCTHETGDFKRLGENLNYSARGLVATFPKYFNSGTAATYANKPEAIASRVYANRLGNGDEQSKEGWIYRGRGYLQITGKTNYKACGDYLGLDLVRQPQLLEDEVNAANSACWFWIKKVRPGIKARINNPSYQSLVKSRNFPTTPQDATNVYVTRHIVNGGTIGLDDVVARYNRYKTDPVITKSNTPSPSTSTATPSTPVAGRTGEKLSTNFYLEDFTRSTAATNKGIDNTPTPEHKAALKALCENVLEKIYSAYQRPLKINSGYRSPSVNRLIGGSSSSQHSRGEAADIEISGIPTIDLANWIKNNIIFDQVILEFYNPKEGPNSGWVHVSYTTKGKNRKSVLTAVNENGKTVYKQGIIGTGSGSTGSTPPPSPTLPADGNPSNTAQQSEQDKDAIEAAKKRRKEQQAFLKAANDSSLSNSVRTLKLSKEMTVTSVVELLALNSTYCLAALRDAETSGMPAFIPYIKVYTTYEFKGYDPRYNVLVKHVTFNVVGIEWAAPAQGGIVNSEEVANQIKDNTIRGYNYLFTGKNADIINLDLVFNSTFYTANARFIEGTNATASSTQSTVSSDQPTTAVSANDPGVRPSSASGSMASSQPVLPDRDNSSKGMPRDFNETEMKFKSLLPSVFAGNPDLIQLEMEIVGDPELIPKTELALTAAEFKNLYLKWESDRGKPLIERSADPTGFSTCFFLFTLGNPDPTLRSNPMFAGYYQFMSITANFKESGAFTMNVNAVKDLRLTVATPEAKATGAALDQEAAKAQQIRDESSGSGVVVGESSATSTISSNNNLTNGSLLSGSFPSLTDSLYTNFMEDLATGLSSATGSFSSNFLNSFDPKVNISSSDTKVTALQEGSVPGMPTSTAISSYVPKRVSSLYKDSIKMFENIDPNPLMDVTKPVQNALFAEFDARDRYESNIENFLGSLTSEPDLINQSQNILQSAIDSFTGAAINGLSNAASDVVTSFLNKAPSLTTGSNISLSSTGNLQTVANSVGTLIGQSVETTLPTVASASSKLSSVIPDFKVPGTPGMLTENSAALQPSLDQLAAEINSKLSLSTEVLEQTSSLSNNLSDGTTNQLQQQMNSPQTSDQLKLDAQLTNNRLKNIARGIPVQSNTLQSAASKIAAAVVSSVGGQAPLPGSSSSRSAVTASTTRLIGSVASAAVASATEQLLKKPANNPLSTRSDMPALPSPFTQEQAVTLEGVSASTLAAIAAAKPAPAIVKSVPAEVSSVTSLTSEQIVTAGKNVLYASMIGTDINSLAAYAKGLSATSLKGLSVKRSV